MDLNLEAAFDEPVDLSHEFEIPAGRLERPELVSLSPVAFAGRLERAEPGFVLNGTLSFSGQIACARCLQPVPFARRSEATWTFVPAHERPDEKAAKAGRAGKAKAAPGRPAKAKKGRAEAEEEGEELLAEELDVLYYDDLVVPFDPYVEEQVQLELPMKALCRDDCRGLCPQCGADRNTAPCDCAPPSDERWQSLKTLLSKNEER